MIQTDYKMNGHELSYEIAEDGYDIYLDASPALLLSFCQIKNRRLDLARHVFCNGGLFTEAMAIRKAYAKYTARTARITTIKPL